MSVKKDSIANQQHPSLLPEGTPRRQIGLALSGGGSRGMALIGVLQAFDERQIRPDQIAGTSIGALVAAFYAFGIPLETMRSVAEEMSWLKVSSLKISRSGLLSNKAIGEIVREHLKDADISEAGIPLAIVAADIGSGEKVVLRSGNVARAVMASSCVPGIFTPIPWGKRLLVDGFLVENVPVSPLQMMGSDLIVAVNLSAHKEYRQPTGLINIIMNAFEIAIDANTQSILEDVDVLIEPDLGGIQEIEEGQAGLLFAKGYQAGVEALPRLLQISPPPLLPPAPPAPTLWRRVKNIFSRS